MVSKRWRVGQADQARAREIAAAAGLPLALAGVLALRGLRAGQEVDRFLDPRLARLSDPFRLPDMERAAGRIWQALAGDETIAVFGDYDADGVTAAALLVRVLDALGARVASFIPDRIDEGYGLSPEALDRCLALHRPSLLVSVDCGTNAVESVERARSRGVDVVVTDHHEPAAATAAAHALVNPKCGTDADLAGLSGAGVAFKLAHALVKLGRGRGSAAAGQIDLRDYLDLAALGTVADIVPLVGENRIIVRHGLDALGTTKWAGLQALKEVAGLHGEADTGHLGFQLGPRINAAGRIGRPAEALRLLVTDDAGEALRIARALDETNRARRGIEQEMAREACGEIDASFEPERHFGLVVAREGWHPGVVGIVASRVARRYNRPAIVMGIDADGVARGSCRSIDAFNLVEGLQACAMHLDRFGGHAMAAGLAVRPGRLEAFKASFNEAAAAALRLADLSPALPIDAVVEAGDLDMAFLGQVMRLRPFGQGNPEPTWAMHGLCHAAPPRVVGQKHLKLALSSGGRTFEAIAFNRAPESLPPGRFDAAFALRENTWNGRTSLQLHLLDWRPNET